MRRRETDCLSLHSSARHTREVQAASLGGQNPGEAGKVLGKS